MVRILPNSALTVEQMDALDRAIPGFRGVIEDNSDLGERGFGELLNSFLLKRDAKKALEAFTSSDPPPTTSAMNTAIAAAQSSWTALIPDTDLTALATADYQSGGDGDKTFAGVTVNAENVANPSSLGLVNSEGLVCVSSTTGNDKTWGTHTAPQISQRLTTIDSDFSPSEHRVRLWCRVNLTSANAQARLFVCGFEQYGRATQINARLVKGYSTAFGSGLGHAVGAALSSSNEATQNGNGSHDVTMIEHNPVTGATWGYSGTYSGGWPAVSAMNKIAVRVMSNSIFSSTFDEDMAFYLAFVDTTATANFEVALSRIKLEYM